MRGQGSSPAGADTASAGERAPPSHRPVASTSPPPFRNGVAQREGLDKCYVMGMSRPYEKPTYSYLLWYGVTHDMP